MEMERFKNFTDDQKLEPIAMTSEEGSVIQKNTEINGDLVTELPICVHGTVTGNIKSSQGITITGEVTGNCEATELFTDKAKVSGDIKCSGIVRIGIGTVVVGNVVADSAVIAGSVNGNVTVDGSVIVDATAAIVGDVSAAAIQVNSGADIEGKCTIGRKDESKISEVFQTAG